MTSEPITWRIDLDTNRPLRYAYYGFFGSLWMVIVLASIGAVLSLVRAIVEPNVVDLLLTGTILLIVVPIVLRLYRDRRSETDDERVLRVLMDPFRAHGTTLEARQKSVPSVDRLLAVAVAFAVFGLLLAWIDVWLVVLCVIVLWTTFFLTVPFAGEGRLDPDGPRFEFDDRTVPLAEIIAYRSVRLPNVVVCWMTFSSGTTATRFRSLVTFTPGAFDAFRASVESVSTETASPRKGDAGIVIVALLFGGVLGSLAVSIWFLTEIPLLVRYYVSLMAGMFGLIVLWLGGVHLAPYLRCRVSR